MIKWYEDEEIAIKFKDVKSEVLIRIGIPKTY